MTAGYFEKEVEIKLRISDALRLRRRLKQLRARTIIPRTFETNTLYDTPSRNLTRKGHLLRIRTEELIANAQGRHPSRALNAVLTYKGRPLSARGSQKRPGRPRFKIRAEVEVSVSNSEQMRIILRALGLRPTFVYEKFRTTFELPVIPGLKVEFDETPVGLFLELEGSPAAIDRAAGLLGYARSNYLTETYGDLYIDDCRRRKKKPAHMVFSPTKKSR